MRNGKEFWVFPGGGQESNETTEEAVVREVKEETNVKCKSIKLLYTHIYPDIKHKLLFYLCEYISGKPKLGNYNEMKSMKDENQIYLPKWVSLKVTPNLLLYPLEIKNWLIADLKNNFEKTPRTETLNSKELLQKI